MVPGPAHTVPIPHLHPGNKVASAYQVCVAAAAREGLSSVSGTSAVPPATFQVTRG